MNSFLYDIIPARARKYVYAVLALASLAYGIWQASDGNIAEFVGSLLVSLVGTTAAANTDAPFLNSKSDSDGEFQDHP